MKKALCACVLRHSSRVQLFKTLMHCRHRQAPLSLGFSRQEYWSGLRDPPPGKKGPLHYLNLNNNVTGQVLSILYFSRSRHTLSLKPETLDPMIR